MDRDRIAALGLTADQVESALSNAFGSRQVTQIYAPNNAYQVIMRVAPEFQRDASALSLLYVRTGEGRQVPLSSVTRVDTGVGPLAVNHTGQLPSVTISFNLRPGIALGDAVTQVESAARAELTDSIATSFQGSGTYKNDGDFNDFVFFITGLTCEGGGEPCDTGLKGACAASVENAGHDRGHALIRALASTRRLHRRWSRALDEEQQKCGEGNRHGRLSWSREGV